VGDTGVCCCGELLFIGFPPEESNCVRSGNGGVCDCDSWFFNLAVSGEEIPGILGTLRGFVSVEMMGALMLLDEF